MLSSDIIEKFRVTLEAEKTKLIGELKEIAVPDRSRESGWSAAYPKFEEEESGSSGAREEEEDEVEEYEVRLEAEHSLESRLLEIAKALRRIEEGVFGVCQQCKKAIPIERLNANPAAEFDIEHSR